MSDSPASAAGGVATAQRAALNRVDHTTLRVTDLETAVSWYEQALDFEVVTRDGDRALLSCGADERVDLVLEAGGTGICSYALGIDSVAALVSLTEDLKARGLDVTPGESPVPGVEAVAELRTPTGTIMQIVAGSSSATGVCAGSRARGVAPVDTDHVTMLVEDVRGFAQWLSETFGFATADAVTLPGQGDAWMAAWTHITAQHHDVALLASPPGPTLHHAAFLAADLNHMGEVADRVCSLGEQRCEWGIGKHGGLGANNYLYVRDPSGNRIEINSNMDAHPFDADTVIYPGEDFGKFISIWNFDPPPASFMEGT